MISIKPPENDKNKLSKLDQVIIAVTIIAIIGLAVIVGYSVGVGLDTDYTLRTVGAVAIAAVTVEAMGG